MRCTRISALKLPIVSTASGNGSCSECTEYRVPQCNHYGSLVAMPADSRSLFMDFDLSGSTRDEEPLVNAWVDRSRSKVLVGWDGRKLAGFNTAVGVLDGDVGAE
ncbi:hypothetical protein EYC80_005859 [Monilinia laxa]|uniref:Uncharacterized protein n=1 Tax=Monilinia laxa TaxID=61186 RepID=A0A5N6KGS3_MONLA|nr:hypothetical protein EYC80_005859 [Monilinia laxa]